MYQRKQQLNEGHLSSKDMQTNVNKHIVNTTREVHSQNLLRTDQLKHSCLAHTIDYIWQSVKVWQKAISILRVHRPDWVL